MRRLERPNRAAAGNKELDAPVRTLYEQNTCWAGGGLLTPARRSGRGRQGRCAGNRVTAQQSEGGGHRDEIMTFPDTSYRPRTPVPRSVPSSRPSAFPIRHPDRAERVEGSRLDLSDWNPGSATGFLRSTIRSDRSGRNDGRSRANAERQTMTKLTFHDSIQETIFPCRLTLHPFSYRSEVRDGGRGRRRHGPKTAQNRRFRQEGGRPLPAGGRATGPVRHGFFRNIDRSVQSGPAPGERLRCPEPHIVTFHDIS